MSYRDFANDHKKGLLKDVLLLYGAEDYLISWAEDAVIREHVSDDCRDLDVIFLDGGQVSAYDIMGEARAYSMFSEKRVVVVRNYLPLYRKASDIGSSELLKFAGSPQNSSVVIFTLESRFSGDITAFGKKMIKACGSYEFARLEKADLRSFIIKRVREAGRLMPGRVLDHMIDVTGYYNKGSSYDLSDLDKDITKIVKACETDEISTELIEEILIGDSDRFVFDLVDALTSGSRGRALSIAEAIIKEEDGAMQVLALLTRQFEIMYDSLELSERGLGIAAMAKKTGINEYRFKKACSAAGRYSKERISSILRELYNADRDIKRGDIDKDAALELTAMTACPRQIR